MVKITNTNIIVDDFAFYNIHNIDKKYIYFLTHMHTDHFKGLSDDWNFGKIYCSKNTAKLLKIKFPKLENIFGLELNKYYNIYLNDDNDENLKMNICLIDSNHIVGSVMIIFKGPMGNFLHTGDFRLNNQILNCKEFFENETTKKIHFDEIFLDNTFCDPIFTFPCKKVCEESIIRIINKNMPAKFIFKTYSLGKEEIGITLSKYYKTKIIINKERFKMLKALNYYIDCFTTNPNEGFIYFVCDKNFEEEKDQKYVHIKMTGWANTQTYINNIENLFMIPYSSHSNFEEIKSLIEKLKPSYIKPIVMSKKKEYDLNELRNTYGYVDSLKLMRQKGLEILKNYLDIDLLSLDYKNFKNNYHKNLFKKNDSEIKLNYIKLKEYFFFNSMNNINLNKRLKPSEIKLKKSKIENEKITKNKEENIEEDDDEESFYSENLESINSENESENLDLKNLEKNFY